MNQDCNQSAVIEEISPEEAAGIMGGRDVTRSLSRVDLRISSTRAISRKIVKKNVVRLTRLKRGKYEVRFRALLKGKKQTVSQTNFRPAGNWNFG